MTLNGERRGHGPGARLYPRRKESSWTFIWQPDILSLIRGPIGLVEIPRDSNWKREIEIETGREREKGSLEAWGCSMLHPLSCRKRRPVGRSVSKAIHLPRVRKKDNLIINNFLLKFTSLSVESQQRGTLMHPPELWQEISAFGLD